MPLRHAGLVLLAVALLPAEPAAAAIDAAARARVEALIRESGAEVAVALRTLDGRDELFLNEADSFHAASTMKVPVMIELFNQADAGVLKLDDRILVTNEFRSIVDASPYTLGVGDDSEPDLYAALGETRSYRELCELMITASSNLATNILIDRLGAERVQATTLALGGEGMVVRRGVEDAKAFRAGLNNTTTAKALLVLLQAVAGGKAVSPAAGREMVEILKRQRFNESIPAGLAPGTPVAHKTGSITRIQHDAAIVYGPRPYVLVVLVRGLDDATKGHALTAGITRVLDAAVNAGAATGQAAAPARPGSSAGAASPPFDMPRPIAARDTVFMEDMTWLEIRDAMRAGRRTAILGAGGIEMNGPYLVAGKHNVILRATTEAIARQLGDALVAPIVPFVPEGSIDPPSGHMRYPSTISVTQDTFKRLLTDIASSLRAHGFEQIFLVADSGGNVTGMQEVAAELTLRWRGGPLVAYVPEYYDYPGLTKWLETQGVHEVDEGHHDDVGITTQMMTVDPDSVRMPERIAAGKFSINGVSLAPAEKSTALGRRVVAWRAGITVAAIRRLRGR